MSIRYPASRPSRRARAILFTVLGLVLGASAASVAFMPPVPDVELDFWGEPVYLDHTPAAMPMDIRIGCRISAFGVAPWNAPGKTKDLLWEIDTRRALRAMSVPDAVVAIAIARMRTGKADDVAGFGDADGLTATGQAYESRFSTTYRSGERRVVCHDSGTRFNSEHRREFATVHRIAHEGTTYHVGEFLACGNVSRFYPAAAAPVPRQMRGEQQPAPEGQAAPRSPSSSPKHAAPGRLIVNQVPEPGVLALSALALVGAVYARKK